MKTAKLPTERITLQFDNATVIFTAENSAATGRVMPELYVQAIDQYRYQRELSVGLKHRPGDSKDLYWESHIYKHPGRRQIQEIPEGVARRFIARFIALCQEYPDLLFNASDPARDRPRHEGFVRIAEMLHDGAGLSCNLL